MIRLFSSQSSLLKLFLVSISLSGSVALSGCGAAGTFPESTAITAAPADVPVGTIKGSNYGGHAPLVGAHIYLLQTGNSGYGSVTKGLLNASYSGSYATTKNVNDQFVPAADSAGNPYYYETADAYGQFNLTGDYTCTVGQPVYIVGYGGSPSFVGNGPNTFPVPTEELYNDGSGYWFTYTTSTPQLFYVGESVVVTGNSSGSAGFNATGVVLGAGKHYDGSAAPLTTTSFSIYLPYSAYPSGGLNIPNTTTPSFSPAAYGGSGVTATGTPVFNPAAVNMAMLGVCPSSGNFSTGATALQYVYMNEISTTAMAYAMNAYVPWGTTDQSGNDEFHIGAPNTTQAQQGIQNAAINAGNLYDIQHAAVSSTGDGEGHLARSTTATGTGIVPQTLIDTIGNTLAACVDSNNTYRNGSGTQSPQCLKLDQYAQDNGYYDTSAPTHYAFNIAQAAFNIAKYPQGMGTATTACSCNGGTQTYTAGTATTASNFTSALTFLPTGNVPFSPYLTTAPNDFAVAINWQTTSLNGNLGNTPLGDIAVDTYGNIWTEGTAINSVIELGPGGTYTTYAPPTGTTVTTSGNGVGIDTSGNVFASAALGTIKLTQTAAQTLTTPATFTTSVIGTGNSANAGQIAIDGTGNLYIANLNTAISQYTSTFTSLAKESNTGVAAGGNFPITVGGYPAQESAGSCVWFDGYLALDSSANIWTSNQIHDLDHATICRFDNLGNLKYVYTLTPGTDVGLPHQIAVDSGNNAWVAEKDQGYLYKIAAGTTMYDTGMTLATGGTLNQPKGVAIDGANTIWVSNTGQTTGSLVHYSNAAASLTPTYLTGTGYGGAGYLETAVDISGNVWALDAGDGELIEYVGAGTPVVSPTSAGNRGTRP